MSLHRQLLVLVPSGHLPLFRHYLLPLLLLSVILLSLSISYIQRSALLSLWRPLTMLTPPISRSLLVFLNASIQFMYSLYFVSILIPLHNPSYFRLNSVRLQDQLVLLHRSFSSRSNNLHTSSHTQHVRQQDLLRPQFRYALDDVSECCTLDI